MFGPEYPKISTLWKRDQRGLIMPGDYTTPEFAYLANVPWRWTEKVGGTNIRLHWNGETVTIGGRTDNAQVPATLIAGLARQADPARWQALFPGGDSLMDVTVYGEGYGGRIGKGSQYRPDPTVIVFDVRVGRWWLRDDDMADVAGKLGLDTVPRLAPMTPLEAWRVLAAGELESRWAGARIEGLVGRPGADLFDRAGDRIITKMKVKDHADFVRRAGKEGTA